MNRQTYVSQAIRTDFSRRLSLLTDAAHRARIDSLRESPDQPRPRWTLDNGHDLIVLCNAQACVSSLCAVTAHITLDRPSARKTPLCPNPNRIGHLHLRTYDLAGDYPDIRRFDERDAERFWGFVTKTWERVRDECVWAISCNKGISRSAACAVALARWLGDTDVADAIESHYLPNQHIVSVLDGTRPS